jgi:integrase/recombinase XerD
MRAAARTRLSAFDVRSRTSELGDTGVARRCDLPRHRQPGRPGPEVLSGEEVSRLIACTTNIKHRAFLLTLYSAGLRLNEASHLKIADIDSQRMQLKVACGKGAKERRVPLSPRLLSELREYWKQYRPTTYLFPGRRKQVPLAPTTIQKVCKAVAAKAGIERNITPHTMRHSFATHLLEAGVDLLAISRLLGHKSFSTTMKYLHVRQLHLHSVPSPADWLPVKQLPGWMQPNNNRSE